MGDLFRQVAFHLARKGGRSVAKFNNLGAMFAHINKAINTALETKVATVVEETMSKNIQSTVYDSYSPVVYERRYELGSRDNIKSEIIEDGILETKNISTPSRSVYGTAYAPQNSTTFSGWVNDGQVPNIFNNRTDYPWMHSRDFIGETVEELKSSGLIRKAMAEGLASTGITVTTNVKRVN